MGNQRMVDIVKKYGPERIMINSAADWGISDPMAVPKTAALMKVQGVPEEHIRLVTFQNAVDSFAPSGQLDLEKLKEVQPVDQSAKYAGNTVLDRKSTRLNSSHVA